MRSPVVRFTRREAAFRKNESQAAARCTRPNKPYLDSSFKLNLHTMPRERF